MPFECNCYLIEHSSDTEIPTISHFRPFNGPLKHNNTSKLFALCLTCENKSFKLLCCSRNIPYCAIYFRHMSNYKLKYWIIAKTFKLPAFN